MLDLTRHRYMLEDTRIGLSLMASAGRMAGVPTPIMDAFVSPSVRRHLRRRIFSRAAARSTTLGVGESRERACRRCCARAFDDRKRIACLGAGRMGRGIAIVFAFSGYEVDLVDFKERSAPDFKLFEAETREELDSTLAIMSRIGLLDAEHVDRISGRITIVPVTGADVLAKASIIFEGLPEVVAVKREGLTRASELAGPSRSSHRPRRPSWSPTSPGLSRGTAAAC